MAQNTTYSPWEGTKGPAAATAAKSHQSCLTLCDPTDGSPPGSSVHLISQARVLEWVAIAFSTKGPRLCLMTTLLLLFGLLWLFSWWLRWKSIRLRCGRPGFDPWVGKIPWRRAWQPTSVFLPGECPWTEEHGRLQSMGLQRVGHDWATKHRLFSFIFACSHFSAQTYSLTRVSHRQKAGRRHEEEEAGAGKDHSVLLCFTTLHEPTTGRLLSVLFALPGTTVLPECTLPACPELPITVHCDFQLVLASSDPVWSLSPFLSSQLVRKGPGTDHHGQLWNAFHRISSESCSVVSDSLQPHRLYGPWNSPGQNTGVGSLSLLQGIFPTQGWNPGLLHCRQILYQLSHKGSPRILEWVAYPF